MVIINVIRQWNEYLFMDIMFLSNKFYQLHIGTPRPKSTHAYMFGNLGAIHRYLFTYVLHNTLFTNTHMKW